MNRLLVVDGTALTFRAFFAIRGLSDRQGRPSGALHGYLASLLRALDDYEPDFIAVAWDLPKPTFRHKLLSSYKANREELDEDLIAQFPWVREVTELLGLPSFDQEGFEADDLLASLAVQGEEAGLEVLLLTSDKDLAQVVTEKVLQCPPPKGNEPGLEMGPKEIKAKHGVPPNQMCDWQAMVGDSSDNIAGLPGVGPKKATLLLEKYGNLDAILTRGPKEEKGKLAENLVTYAEQVRKALDLVTLRTDLKVGKPTELTPFARDEAALQDFLQDHDLTSISRRLEKKQPNILDIEPVQTNLFENSKEAHAEAHQEAGDYKLVDSPEALATLRDSLNSSEGFAFDTETTSVDPMQANLVGMSFSWKEGEAFYLPLNLEEKLTGPNNEDPVDFIKPALEDPLIPKTGQNIKYDLQVMARHGVAMQGIKFDTMIAHFLVHPDEQHNLDALSLRYLNLHKVPTSSLLGRGKDSITMDQVPIDRVREYAGEDADATWRLAPPLREELAEHELEDLMNDLEIPLLPVLARMEQEGVAVDPDRLKSLSETLNARIEDLAAIIYELAGEEFNLNSPKQVGPILFETLKVQDEAGLSPPGKTKTGGWRTNAPTLEKYAGVPAVDALLEHRSVSKLLSGFVKALPQFVHPETGRIHTSFNQAIAATGRLSSSDPNLQNIPIRSAEGRRIREAFIPREIGWSLVSADYSQVELRLLAHFSKDPALCTAFAEGADIHARTAALVAGIPEKDVTSEERARAKAVNFGILYGMGSQRLARELGISISEAKTFIEHWFAALPMVRKWLDTTLEQAEEKGETRTLLGRRRSVPGLGSSDGRVAAFSKNMAVNSPIQGSAADLIKIAMLRVDRRIHQESLRARMIIQVHDELVFDCPDSELSALESLVREEMEGAYSLEVPLVVDIGKGSDWAQAH
ncbi:MAG TPA: DNA polymerase I [Planctomycetes bacterium]|nr:DNA polymerase I [Planctomycetota bacterium]